jgi:hypothetical protein
MTGARPVVAWGEAGAALDGAVSGDLLVVAPFAHGALVAVLDGLGHGHEAAKASRAAARVLEARAAEPVLDLLERCHEALRGTRGAVMSVASFDARASAMTWAGVGNVDAVLVRGNRAARPPREDLAPRGGIVGYTLPPLRASTLAVSAGDTLVLATDGLKTAFASGVDLGGEPQAVAEAILARHARGTDDALVAVVRYLGEAA